MTCEKHYWYHGPLVDCPHCETDRLRAELEDKNKLLDSCSMQLNETANERNSLRAELARRPTDVLCLGKHGQITVLTDCPECVKEELAKAQEENAKLFGWYKDAEQGMARRNERILELNIANERKRFNPDWDRTAAALDSIREHMAIAKAANERSEKAEARIKELEAENMTLRCRNKAQHAEIKATTAYSIGQDKALAAQQKRIKELELALSEQYIKGMEDAVDIARACDGYFVAANIKARIAEIKRAAESKERKG